MTLIEIIIVVAIIGIMSSIAVPNYSAYILQQRRTDAHQLLEVNAHRLQRCLTLAGTYDWDADGDGDGDCNLVLKSAEGYYELKPTLAAQTWSLTAEAVSGGKQEHDANCASFSLNQTGQKTATGKKPDSCW